METELKTLVEFIYHQSDDNGGIEILFLKWSLIRPMVPIMTVG